MRIRLLSVYWPGRCSAPRHVSVSVQTFADRTSQHALHPYSKKSRGFDLATESRSPLKAELRPGKLREHLAKNLPGQLPDRSLVEFVECPVLLESGQGRALLPQRQS